MWRREWLASQASRASSKALLLCTFGSPVETSLPKRGAACYCRVILQQRLQQVPLRAAGLPLAPATLPHQLQPLHAAHPQFLAMRPGFHPGVPGMGMQQMLVPGAVPQQLNMAAFAVMQAQAHAAMVEQKRKLDAEAATEAPDAKLQRTIPQQDGPADDAGHEIAEGEAQGTVAAAAEAKEEEGKEDDDDPLSEDDDDGSGELCVGLGQAKAPLVMARVAGVPLADHPCISHLSVLPSTLPNASACT